MSRLLCAIEWAAQNKLNIVNASLGFPRIRNAPHSIEAKLIGKLLRREKNMMLIAAAGNKLEASSDAGIDVPASSPGACAVGGIEFPRNGDPKHALLSKRGDRVSSILVSGPFSVICDFGYTSLASAYVSACCANIMAERVRTGLTIDRASVLNELRKKCIRPVSPWNRNRGGAGIPIV